MMTIFFGACVVGGCQVNKRCVFFSVEEPRFGGNRFVWDKGLSRLSDE